MYKKILAILLSILTLLSVMTAVAYATNVDNQQAMVAQGAGDDVTVPATEESVTEPGVTRPEWADKFEGFWKVFYPVFDMLYKSGFVLLSQFLAQVVNWFITGMFN